MHVRLTGFDFQFLGYNKIILHFIISLCPGIFFGCSTTGNIIGSYTTCEIPFRMIGTRVPVIELRLNEKKAWFIVDTGAAYTLLNSAMANRFRFYVSEDTYRNSIEIKGIGGKMLLYETLSCKLDMGHLSIRHLTLRSGDISRLSNSIKRNEKIDIAGIIGSDFLAKYRININYDSRTLTYKVKSKNIE